MKQLVSFGSSGSDTSKILLAANYVREELLIRFAHRIRDFQQLPYGLVTSAHVKGLYELYVESFDRLCPSSTITSIGELENFIGQLERHDTTINVLFL